MQTSKTSKLQALIEEEKSLLQEELQRLYSLFCTIDEVNSEAAAGPSDLNPVENTSGDAEEESSVNQAECIEDLTWDSSQDITLQRKIRVISLIRLFFLHPQFLLLYQKTGLKVYQ